jgi:methionyl aminopeptidase
MAGIARGWKDVDATKAPLKTADEVEGIRRANQGAGEVLTAIGTMVRPGVTVRELDTFARQEIEKRGMSVDRHGIAFDYGHRAYLTDYSDLMSISWGVNDSLSYLPVSDRALAIGDVLTADCSVMKDGWAGDTARPWIVGQEASFEARTLVHVALATTWMGVSMCRPGRPWNEIAAAMDACASGHGMRIVRWGPEDAENMGMGCSHSIGHVHNDGWNLVNYADPRNDGKVLEAGMVITIEPMLTSGNGEGFCDGSSTQWSADGALVAFWEHVVAITADGHELLDARAGEEPPDIELLASYGISPHAGP